MKGWIPLPATALAAFAIGYAASTLISTSGGLSSRGNRAATTAATDTFKSGGARLTGAKKFPNLLFPDGAPLSADDLAERISSALAEGDPMERYGQIWLLSKQVTSQSARKVADLLLKQQDMESRYSVILILRAWARLDPQAALAYAQQLPNALRNEGVSSAIGGWAANNYGDASAWVENLPKGEQKRRMQNALVSALAVNDPEHALQLVLAAPTSQRNGFSDGIFAIFSRLAHATPERAAERAASLPAGQLRNLPTR